MGNPSVVGYVLLSPEGIPIRHHERMPYQTAVLYASLITDYAQKSRSVLAELSTNATDGELLNFRFRTKDGTEIITTACSEYLLVVIQNCTGKPWVWAEEEGRTE